MNTKLKTIVILVLKVCEIKRDLFMETFHGDPTQVRYRFLNLPETFIRDEIDWMELRNWSEKTKISFSFKTRNFSL